MLEAVGAWGQDAEWLLQEALSAVNDAKGFPAIL